jgi:hypothetical protein
MRYVTEDLQWRHFNDGTEGADGLYVRVYPRENGLVYVNIDGGFESEGIECDREDLERIILMLRLAQEFMGDNA